MMEMGANAYLTKTTDPEEIYQAILTCMNDDFYFNELVNKAVLLKLQHKKTVRQFYPNPVKLSEKEILNKILVQVSDLKEKEKEISSLKVKLASGSEDELLDAVVDVKGIKLIAGEVINADANSLRDLADKLRTKIGSGLVVLGSNSEGKISLVAMASKDVIEKGIHCGKIIKAVAAITGGGGGGRPDMAQAGGKKPDKLKEAIGKVTELVENSVK